MSTPNEIQAGRFNGILHKLFDMKEGAPSPTLATDIFPNIVLENDRPEWRFLAGVRLGSMRWADAAVAANYSSVGIRNPTGSGVLVVVRNMRVIPSSTGIVQLGIRAVSTVDASNPFIPLDSRWLRTGAAFYCQAQMVERTQVTVPAYPQFQVASSAGLGVWTDVPVILSPGYEVMVFPNTVNVQVSLAAWIEERPLNPSETR